MSRCAPLQHHDPDKAVRAYRAYRDVIGPDHPLLRDCVQSPISSDFYSPTVCVTTGLCAGDPPACSRAPGRRCHRDWQDELEEKLSTEEVERLAGSKWFIDAIARGR